MQHISRTSYTDFDQHLDAIAESDVEVDVFFFLDVRILESSGKKLSPLSKGRPLLSMLCLFLRNNSVKSNLYALHVAWEFVIVRSFYFNTATSHGLALLIFQKWLSGDPDAVTFQNFFQAVLDDASKIYNDTRDILQKAENANQEREEN